MVELDISSFQGPWDLGVKGQDDVLLRFRLKLYVTFIPNGLLEKIVSAFSLAVPCPRPRRLVRRAGRTENCVAYEVLRIVLCTTQRRFLADFQQGLLHGS